MGGTEREGEREETKGRVTERGEKKREGCWVVRCGKGERDKSDAQGEYENMLSSSSSPSLSKQIRSRLLTDGPDGLVGDDNRLGLHEVLDRLDLFSTSARQGQEAGQRTRAAASRQSARYSRAHVADGQRF